MLPRLDEIRARITAAKVSNEDDCLDELMSAYGISEEIRKEASVNAERLVDDLRSSAKPNILDSLLAEYGLSSPAGTALLRISEALMRVPDKATMDELIADKIVDVDWDRHRGKSNSRAVNLATHGLALAAFLLKGSKKAGPSGAARRTLKRICTPSARIAVRKATKLVAGRFVHGRTIEQSLRRAVSQETNGYTLSYDMLGEAALTLGDAERFFDDYKSAIEALTPKCTSADFRDNPGVSIKLSALHPRYELTQRDRVLTELTARTSALARLAKDAPMGINIDAEEADRLELSMDVIESVLRNPELAGWDGFGIVVQAYNKAAPHVLDFLYELATSLDRKIMVRLVKGAYWDTEIKRAQVEGLEEFPVYTRKSATDVSYLCCAKKLLGMTDRIYPQFAGHNAHTVSAILELAGDDRPFEFQRIHGMGEALHDRVIERENTRCRIYAPVGNHRELLPYLARRMLENGANTSFVNQIASRDWKAVDIAADPFEALERSQAANFQPIAEPKDLFGQGRLNSKGWDLHNPAVLKSLDSMREPLRTATWSGAPILAVEHRTGSETRVVNPANPSDTVGSFSDADADTLSAALEAATVWKDASAIERGRVLVNASDLYEERAEELFALLCREAGKSLADATAELREAVDFLRYYGSEAAKQPDLQPVGLVACISPWNFPLAIFTGQIAGALAGGNGVLAKPAEQTPLIAALAVDILHQAGVPRSALQLLPGKGETIGRSLVSDPRIAGVAFTGSTETARNIDRNMARSLDPSSRLVAETGGLNAMIVDSTALPEQAIKDIIASSFQSAGQRCSALRVLFVQEEISEQFSEMLFGAMDELKVGDPWDKATDVGPLIDRASQQQISAYIDRARVEGRLLKQCEAPGDGFFVGPAVIGVNSMSDVTKEIFGPVLHLAKFAARDLDRVVEAVNRCGYGLTFGMHSRIDSRIYNISGRIKVGNIYINRNQIGAVVGSQPFGGEGLSGTGPKAGGPYYPKAFLRIEPIMYDVPSGAEAKPRDVQAVIDRTYPGGSGGDAYHDMPGPTGETNHLFQFGRGRVLCLGPTEEAADNQAKLAMAAGCSTVQVAEGAEGDSAVSGFLPREALASLENFDAVVLWSTPDDLKKARLALASRSGPLIPLISSADVADRCSVERHICTDTTAAGGNATLYAEVGEGAPRT